MMSLEPARGLGGERVNALCERMSLTLPGRSQYISVARLALAGFASEQDVSLDDIEDLKLALAEACGQVLCDASTRLTLLVECRIDARRLELEVRGVPVLLKVGGSEGPPPADAGVSRRRQKSRKLAICLIEAIMDEVFVETVGICPVVRMMKTLGVETHAG